MMIYRMQNKSIFTTLAVLSGLFLSACSSDYKPLKAPCTYDHPNNCGPVVPMVQVQAQQNLSLQAKT